MFPFASGWSSLQLTHIFALIAKFTTLQISLLIMVHTKLSVVFILAAAAFTPIVSLPIPVDSIPGSPHHSSSSADKTPPSQGSELLELEKNLLVLSAQGAGTFGHKLPRVPRRIITGDKSPPDDSGKHGMKQEIDFNSKQQMASQSELQRITAEGTVKLAH